jgi:C4-dicarboxylate transporter DctM subunit
METSASFEARSAPSPYPTSFPPVGMIAFVVASSANVSLVKVYTGTSILMIALVLTTVLLMVFPQIALWLPATMK